MLTFSEQKEIAKITKKGTNARVICRANVLNMRNTGQFTVSEVATALNITEKTVCNIEDNYTVGGLQKALYDDPRPGAAPKFDDSLRSQIVALVCSDPPEGFDRWTLDLIVEKAKEIGVVSSIHRDTVRVILQEHDFKPWQQKMWCIPKLDKDYIDKMEDILDVYERNFPSEISLICLDEKMVHLTEDTRPPCGGLPGKARRVDFEYKRNGSANVFCAVLPKEGLYMTEVTERRTKNDFARFLGTLEKKFSNSKKMVLVMDNLNTHKEESLTEFYGSEEGRRIWNRFEVHYTPKHGSWLNQAEVAINMYARQCLGKSRIPTIKMLRKKTEFWSNAINQKKVTINWKFTKEKARKKFSYKV